MSAEENFTMPKVEYVTVPKALLAEVLDTAMADGLMVEMNFAFGASERAACTAEQEKISQLREIANGRGVARMYEGPYHRTGIFKPKNMETLRPCMLPMIGKRFDWDFAGEQGEDMAFAGQSTWTPSRKHDPDLTSEQKGAWAPDEDIEFR